MTIERGTYRDFMVTIGYEFNDLKLLETALTHRSFGQEHNERLEFLGDALLSAIIATTLFTKFPDATEGQLSRLRSYLVKGHTLSEIAMEYGFGNMLRLGVGEKKAGGAQRRSILADSVEAVIGAIYLDGGMEQCCQMVLKWYADRLSALSLDELHKDAKSRLQEYLQSKQLPLPAYVLIDTVGAAHERLFVVECRVEGLAQPVRAEASSIRKAEQEVASVILQEIADAS